MFGHEVINIRQSHAPRGAKHFCSRAVTLPKLFPLLSIFSPSTRALFSVTAHNLSLLGGGGTHSRGSGSTAYLLHTHTHTLTRRYTLIFFSLSPHIHCTSPLLASTIAFHLTLRSPSASESAKDSEKKQIFSANWVKFTLLEENTELFSNIHGWRRGEDNTRALTDSVKTAYSLHLILQGFLGKNNTKICLAFMFMPRTSPLLMVISWIFDGTVSTLRLLSW